LSLLYSASGLLDLGRGRSARGFTPGRTAGKAGDRSGSDLSLTDAGEFHEDLDSIAPFESDARSELNLEAVSLHLADLAHYVSPMGPADHEQEAPGNGKNSKHASVLDG
jgi:hypothetical protein